MRKLITILLGFALMSMSNMPLVKRYFVGEEIFRRDASSATGWEWKNSGGTWADMALAFSGVGYGTISNSSTTETIEGFVFIGPPPGTNGDHCLRLSNVSNKTIQRNLFIQGIGLGVYLYGGSDNCVIQQNLIANQERGVLVDDCDDGNIKVHANQFLNMQWNRTAGGTIAGQYIQIIITTGPGLEITANKGESFFGESETEDLINCNGSNGTSGSHLKIEGNIFRGGGWSESGGGILAGDDGGGYTDVDSNILVNPGNYGFHFSCGHDMLWSNNKVYSDQLPWSGNGFVLGYGACGAGNCNNITMGSGNYSNFTKYDATTANFISNPGVCTAPGGGSVPSPNTGQTLASMDMPVRLLDYINDDDELYLRSLKVGYAQLVIDGDTDAFSPYAYSTGINVRRPTAVLDITGSGSTRTFDATGSTADNSAGGTGTNTLDAAGYSYTVVSGPNSPTIVSPTASSTSVTGLINGTYVIRLQVTQTNGQSSLKTYHWDWFEFTVTGVSSGTKMPVRVVKNNNNNNNNENTISPYSIDNIADCISAKSYSYR